MRDRPSEDSVERTGRVGKIKLPWYSFDHGMVHLVMMSTEHDFGWVFHQRLTTRMQSLNTRAGTQCFCGHFQASLVLNLE